MTEVGLVHQKRLSLEKCALMEKVSDRKESMGMIASLQTSIFVAVETGGFQELIESGVELPTHAYRHFSTAEDNQDSLVVDLGLGKSGEVKPVVRLLINDIELTTKGVPRIEIVFKIDGSNQMTFEVRDFKTGRALPFNMQRYL